MIQQLVCDQSHVVVKWGGGRGEKGLQGTAMGRTLPNQLALAVFKQS